MASNLSTDTPTTIDNCSNWASVGRGFNRNFCQREIAAPNPAALASPVDDNSLARRNRPKKWLMLSPS
jgi:hypothetical protein